MEYRYASVERYVPRMLIGRRLVMRPSELMPRDYGRQSPYFAN